MHGHLRDVDRVKEGKSLEDKYPCRECMRPIGITESGNTRYHTDKREYSVRYGKACKGAGNPPVGIFTLPTARFNV